MPVPVLDASALLAYLRQEPGGEHVTDAIAGGCAVSDEDAIEAARLHPLTRTAGLSLGDRLCLALTRRLGGVALSVDRPWSKVKLDVAVELIR